MSQYPANSQYQSIIYVVVSPRGKVVVVAENREIAEAFLKEHRKDTGETCSIQISDYFVK